MHISDSLAARHITNKNQRPPIEASQASSQQSNKMHSTWLENSAVRINNNNTENQKPKTNKQKTLTICR